jgi:MFS family permease
MPNHISGLVSGFVNMIVMIGGVVFQPLVGWILDFFWKGTMIEGVRSYSAYDYRLALAILPLSTLLAVFLGPLLRETYPHRQVSKRVPISGET